MFVFKTMHVWPYYSQLYLYSSVTQSGKLSPLNFFRSFIFFSYTSCDFAQKKRKRQQLIVIISTSQSYNIYILEVNFSMQFIYKNKKKIKIDREIYNLYSLTENERATKHQRHRDHYRIIIKFTRKKERARRTERL